MADFSQVMYIGILQSFSLVKCHSVVKNQPHVQICLHLINSQWTEPGPCRTFFFFNNQFHSHIWNMEEKICRYFRYIATLKTNSHVAANYFKAIKSGILHKRTVKLASLSLISMWGHNAEVNQRKLTMTSKPLPPDGQQKAYSAANKRHLCVYGCV